MYSTPDIKSSLVPWMQANGVRTLDDVKDISTTALAKGGSGDVYKAAWCGRQVVLKVFRGDPKLALKKLRRELNVWRLLCHAHIQELLGVHWAGEVLTLVSPLYEFTNLYAYFQYCRRYMESTSVEILKTRLLRGVLLGLDYLHTQSPPIIHGDIKADNIFVTGNGAPVIGDFGASVQVTALRHNAASPRPTWQRDSCNSDVTTSTSNSALRGTLRWMAPELVREDNPVHTIATDIWAFGCLVLEVMSETIPFSNLTNDMQVILMLQNGGPPPRPSGLVRSAWRVVEYCCRGDVSKRPRSVAHVQSTCRRISGLSDHLIAVSIESIATQDRIMRRLERLEAKVLCLFGS